MILSTLQSVFLFFNHRVVFQSYIVLFIGWKLKKKSWVWSCTFNPQTQRQMGLCLFKASLVYLVSGQPELHGETLSKR